MLTRLFSKLKYWAKKLYFEQNSQAILKLIDIRHCEKTNREICLVQVSGKNAFAEFDVDYLVNHKKMISAFFHEDIVAITRSYERTKSNFIQIAFKIREIYTHDPNKKNIVLIEEIGEASQFHTISLDELRHDKKLLNKFKPEEAFRFGYMVAAQEIEAEFEMINKIKKHENG